tara:strand:- start:2028 stop:2837 length:810 start_codon:yes stop_codon:yes gene_type:complete
MKTLYEFTSSKKEKVKVPHESKNEAGETVTTQKEEEQNICQYFAIRKPTRSLFDEGELFYGVRVAEGVKAGMLTNQMLSKRYLDDGGLKSETEENFENLLYSRVVEKRLLFQELETKENRTDEENIELAAVKKDIIDLEIKAQKYQAGQGSLYDQTAESRARDKTITWWAVNLCYRKIETGNGEGFEYEPFFKGDSYEEKIDNFDLFEELEDGHFENKVLRRFLYLVSFWYVGRAVKSEDFKEMEEKIKEMSKDDDHVADFGGDEIPIE